jgi:hypothetical protein
MEVFKEYLSNNEITRLSHAIGQKITCIKGEGLWEDNNIYNSFHLFITLENDYVLHIYNEWKETPNENDYYKLHVEDNKTKEIETHHELDAINISFKGIVSSIDIFNTKGVWDEELLDYDVALCFTSDEGEKFLVYLFEDVSDQVEFTNDIELINKELGLDIYNLRKSLSLGS